MSFCAKSNATKCSLCGKPAATKQKTRPRSILFHREQINKQPSRKITENCTLHCIKLYRNVLGWLSVTMRMLHFTTRYLVLTVFSPLQAGAFAVTGSHVSPSSHLDYAESHHLTLERDLPEKLKKKKKVNYCLAGTYAHIHRFCPCR